MLFRQLFEPKLAQYAYLIGCQRSGEALVIDPLRDVDVYLEAAEEDGLELVAAAETHIHADFLSGVRELVERFELHAYLSAQGGADWHYRWATEDGGDRVREGVTLLSDGDSFRLGEVELRAIHTPGHTPEHMSYLVHDRGSGASTPLGVASGDFVFVGDLGRPDLLEAAAGVDDAQEDSARQLYRSLPRFRALEDHLQVWPGHGSGSSCGKSLAAIPASTVGYEKRQNPALAKASEGEEAFIEEILTGQQEPPLYFGRVKLQNRDGPPLLDDPPRPRRIAVGEVARVLEEGGALVVDTRTDRSAFMARHLPGSIYAPMTRSFNTVVGSLVEDADRPLVLVIDSSHVEEAVRDLVRIGHDRVRGYIAEETLQRYRDRGGRTASIEEIDFEALDRLREREGYAVLDVRYGYEYAEGHVPDAVGASFTRLPEYEGDRFSPGPTWLVHCEAGVRSAVASAWLAARGYDVRYVNDDWSRWEESGRPTESAPEAGAARV